MDRVLSLKVMLNAGENIEQPCIFATLLLTLADDCVVPISDYVEDQSYAVPTTTSNPKRNVITVAAHNVVINYEI